PPYNKKSLQKALPQLVEKMSERGVIICEHEKECTLPREIGGFEISKVLRHGTVSVTIYRRAETEEGEEE
ncbi:MAG: RsmD family RNA methyltransferase, partial [Oscillospiraceae bacterium]